MNFDFDPDKSESNRLKHNIDFEQAQGLWNDPLSVIIPARTVDEVRFLLIGSLNQKLWSAVFTVRDEEIRIISVRRARKNEEEIYLSL